MSFDFRRRRKDAQVFERQFVTRSVIEAHVENTRFGS
jgi:hypothetical protein